MSGEVPVLSTEGLEVRYGKREVLAGVSFAVPAGSVFALLGRNGAGKSSLVRCALGMQKPRRGVARLFGADAWRSRRRAMERVGVVPEEPDAPPEMTATEILDFCGALYPVWHRKEALGRLARFDVPLDLAFGRLSKGQKGAVMLALALASEPDLLILDDPTLGLDAVARRALYDELIGELADRGTTVFVTTHDLAGIEAIADRVAILHGTRLVMDESVESVKARFRRIRCGATTAGFSWAPFTVARSLEREWGREAVVTDFDEDRLARFEAQPSVADVEVGALSLEDVFLAVAEAPGGAA
jgi:ABC-2 type transport system ATP-binding protein